MMIFKGIFIIYAITTLVATLAIRIGGPILEDINRALQVEQGSGKLRKCLPMTVIGSAN